MHRYSFFGIDSVSHVEKEPAMNVVLKENHSSLLLRAL